MGGSGTCVTALIAIAAATTAFVQVREARQLRIEQAQPYVAAYLESDAANPKFVDLVVKNFGTTAASNVQIDVDPTPQRSKQGGGVEDMWVAEKISTLVPRQEWRTLWDFGPDRVNTDLPDHYTVRLAYTDSRERKLDGVFSLDWGQFKNRQWVEKRGLHDAANALREINKRLKKWDAGINKGLRVSLRDGSGQGVPPDEQRL